MEDNNLSTEEGNPHIRELYWQMAQVKTTLGDLLEKVESEVDLRAVIKDLQEQIKLHKQAIAQLRKEVVELKQWKE